MQCKRVHEHLVEAGRVRLLVVEVVRESVRGTEAEVISGVNRDPAFSMCEGVLINTAYTSSA